MYIYVRNICHTVIDTSGGMLRALANREIFSNLFAVRDPGTLSPFDLKYVFAFTRGRVKLHHVPWI